MTMMQLANTMSATEYDLWIEDYAANPWGCERGDMQAAVIASEVANKNVKGGNRRKIADFLLKFTKARKKLPTPDELADKVEQTFTDMFTAFGGGK